MNLHIIVKKLFIFNEFLGFYALDIRLHEFFSLWKQPFNIKKFLTQIFK